MKMQKKRALPIAAALACTLALAACSSNDDDDNASGSTGDGTDMGGDTGGDTGGGTDTQASLSFPLTTGEEVPPLAAEAPDAGGQASLNLDGTVLSGEITVTGLTGQATMAHIHRGFAGQSGPDVVALEDTNGDGTLWSVPADTDLATNAAGDLTAVYSRGELYINVHTDANKDGEIRGQIVPGGDAAPTRFTVTLANVSTDQTLPTSGDPVAVPLSPGAYLVHRETMSPLLEPRDTASEALEMVAEDGDPSGFPALVAGAVIFNTPVGADGPAPIGPGGSYELSFTAVPGDKLSFVTMFIQSNDYFYTPTDEDDSIELFGADGTPVSGDVSDQIELWDAGTEQDQAPGEGADQAPRQAGPDTGAEEGAAVASLSSMEETVQLNGAVLQVTVTPAAP